MVSITAIIPARNEEAHIAGCLESLLDQTAKLSQIIVVLDRCTDGTEEQVNLVARKYDKISKVVKSSTKYSKTFMKGFYVAEAVNQGLEHAKPFSDFIMICNADSTYSQSYVEEALQIMREYPDCGIVGYPHYSNVSGSGYVMRASLLYRLGNRLTECAAEDTYLQMAALQLGYTIKPIVSAEVVLMRERGQGGILEKLRYAFAKGYSSYTLGYSLYYELGRSLFWFSKGKFSHVAIIFGFLYGIITGAEKLDIAATDIAKEWQRSRLKSVFSS